MTTGSTGFISHWQGIFEVPPAAVDPIQKETADTLLRKLIEQNDPKHAPAAFILAVMLERKRLLKLKETLQRERTRASMFMSTREWATFSPSPIRICIWTNWNRSSRTWRHCSNMA